ncbi:MAG: GntR family transcriptional regulator [Clostridia bacterium]
MFSIDLKSRVPIYEQLKNCTLELIMHGVLTEGMKLPSVRNLAKELGINPNTIQKAYQQMEVEGIINSFSTKGSFIAKQTMTNPFIRDRAIEKLKNSAYDVRLYGVELETALEAVRQSYEK